MRRFVGWILATAALTPACGSSDKGTDVGGSGGGTASAGGVTGTSGTASSGGTGGVGASTGGAANVGDGGAGSAFVCTAPGTALANGACYVPCVYDPGSPPRYEAPGGVCTSIGWKCSALQQCNPNIHCSRDVSCQQLGGPGWVCVPTPDGPLVGQCAIHCAVDADCPDTKGMTPSPYLCKPVTDGTTTVNICRF